MYYNQYILEYVLFSKQNLGFITFLIIFIIQEFSEYLSKILTNRIIFTHILVKFSH